MCGRVLGQFIVIDEFGAFCFVLFPSGTGNVQLFPSRGYITMHHFAYNMNLLACMSFPSPESYIYH